MYSPEVDILSVTAILSTQIHRKPANPNALCSCWPWSGSKLS